MDQPTPPYNPTDNLEGKVLGGTYQVLRKLGEGGVGVVYEARHIRVGSRFAAKILRHKVAADPTLRARFKREAMLGSRLGHEHIVQVFDFDSIEEGFPYIIMELLLGEDLNLRLRRDGPMGLVKAASITRHVALALAAAHQEGVIHRDLKPGNIFLVRRQGGGEQTKVLDFGFSKVLLSATMATTQGQLLGTPSYMSPEQARGRTQEIDAPSDIFCLGLVLYHMLAGRQAFNDKSMPALLYKIVHDHPPPLSDFRSDLPQGIIDLVRRATAKEKDDRHASAGELLEELTLAMGRRWQDVLMLDLAQENSSASQPAIPRPAPLPEPPPEPTPPAPGPEQKPRPEQTPRSGALLGIILLTIVVLLVSAGGYLAYRHFASGTDEVSPPDPADSKSEIEPR